MPSPAPWRFHKPMYSFSHVLVDADGRILTSNVRIDDGRLMATAPAMLAILRRVAKRCPEGDELGDLARRVISFVDSDSGAAR